MTQFPAISERPKVRCFRVAAADTTPGSYQILSTFFSADTGLKTTMSLINKFMSLKRLYLLRQCDYQCELEEQYSSTD